MIIKNMNKNYTSDITNFINLLKIKDPSLEERQLEGRNLLWDKVQDLQLLEDFKQATIPQEPYVYDYYNLREDFLGSKDK